MLILYLKTQHRPCWRNCLCTGGRVTKESLRRRKLLRADVTTRQELVDFVLLMTTLFYLRYIYMHTGEIRSQIQFDAQRLNGSRQVSNNNTLQNFYFWCRRLVSERCYKVGFKYFSAIVVMKVLVVLAIAVLSGRSIFKEKICVSAFFE